MGTASVHTPSTTSARTYVRCHGIHCWCLQEDASFGSELKGILTEMDDDLQRIVDKLSAPDAQRRLTP
eukprot:scaffold180802_cov19-Tisochrysis_lutea.AAC.1